MAAQRQKVRVIHDPHANGLHGRAGVIISLCGEEFVDYVYVRFDPTGSQRGEQIRMISLECLDPYK